MLKSPLQVAIFFALIALVIKLTIFGMEMQHGDMEIYIRYIYMFVLLAAVFFGIRANKTVKSKTSFTEDFLSGARTAAFFALLMGGITYIYYTQIDTNFFEVKKQEELQYFPEKIAELIDEKGIEATREIVYQKVLGMNTIYTPWSQTSFTLFGLVFLGLFNSLIFALLMRKLPGFRGS